MAPAFANVVARTAIATGLAAMLVGRPAAAQDSLPAARTGHDGEDTALADPARRPSVVVWPTLTPAGDSPGPTPLHKPELSEGRIYERAMELDATLRDAVEDLGYTLYVADNGPTVGRTRDEDLLERAARSARGQRADDAHPGTWVVSPRIEGAGGGDYIVRIVAVPPSGHELRTRVETVAGDRVAVRGLVMLRDLLTAQTAAAAARETAREDAARGSTQGVFLPARSQGRAVLAVNAGLVGAFTAFSLQQASGSSDPRVLYPLLAVGTGIGIGAALLAADEWDVTTGDAWYFAAGALWGASAGLLIAAGNDVQPSDDRYAWGMGGALLGAGLATFALTRSTMDDGDAALVHSGGALGLAFGAATQFLYEGSTATTPSKGMGYGTAVGLLGAGLLATRVTLSPSRMLLLDLGVGGGALIGAAAASPLVFNDQTKGSTRGWLSATVGGALVGGALAYWLTRDATPAPRAWWRTTTPTAGVIATTSTHTGTIPVYGAALSGSF